MGCGCGAFGEDDPTMANDLRDQKYNPTSKQMIEHNKEENLDDIVNDDP